MKELRISVRKGPADEAVIRTAVYLDDEHLVDRSFILLKEDVANAKMDLLDLMFERAKRELKELIAEGILERLHP